MTADNLQALRYILQEDLYLLERDKSAYQAADGMPVVVPETDAVPAENHPQPAAAAPVVPAPVIETPKIIYRYLGQNKKHFLILVNYTGTEHMVEAHLNALGSTLVRKGSALDDTAVLNMAHYVTSTYNDLLQEFKPQRILVLGEGAVPHGLSGTILNQIININDVAVLYSYSFDEMMGNKDKTRAFWEQMKNL